MPACATLGLSACLYTHPALLTSDTCSLLAGKQHQMQDRRVYAYMLTPHPSCRPARGDLVAVVGETFGDAAVRNMAARMRANPVGQQILAERPRVTVRVLPACRKSTDQSW